MENNSCPISCGCVGYAYVPEQELRYVYNTAEDALENGTLFPELELSIDEYGMVCKGMGEVCSDGGK